MHMAKFRPSGMVFMMFLLEFGSGNCKPTSITDQQTTTGNSTVLSKVVRTSGKNPSAHSSVNQQPTIPVIPSSTEYTSTEITTRSAENIGLHLLENFRRKSENLKIATNTLFNEIKSSEESTYYIASLSDNPSIPNEVIEKVQNCTDMQDIFQSIFDVIYSYERKVTPIPDYLYRRYPGQRSLQNYAFNIHHMIWSLMIDVSLYIIPVPVTETTSSPLDYMTVLETLATLHVQSEVLSGIFLDLKNCS